MSAKPSDRRAKHRVFIVDDHPMMRLGLVQFLAQEPGLEVCGEASNAANTLTAVERLNPDVVLVDISLQGRSGLDLIKDLRARFPETKLLVHSMHDERLFAERALRAGAHGYVMKQETGDTIAIALRQVLRGEIYLTSRARKSVVSQGGSRAGHQKTSPIAALTDREFEVFRLIGHGCVNRDIAGQLHISVKTVEAHRERIKRRLGATSATALNLLAVRWAASEQTV